MLSPGTESVVLPLQSREEMGFSEQKGEMDVGQVKNCGNESIYIHGLLRQVKRGVLSWGVTDKCDSRSQGSLPH